VPAHQGRVPLVPVIDEFLMRQMRQSMHAVSELDHMSPRVPPSGAAAAADSRQCKSTRTYFRFTTQRQSLALSSVAAYWHIGETVMRFGRRSLPWLRG
jgi:hypothetical protein